MSVTSQTLRMWFMLCAWSIFVSEFSLPEPKNMHRWMPVNFVVYIHGVLWWHMHPEMVLRHPAPKSGYGKSIDRSVALVYSALPLNEGSGNDGCYKVSFPWKWYFNCPEDDRDSIFQGSTRKFLKMYGWSTEEILSNLLRKVCVKSLFHENYHLAQERFFKVGGGEPNNEQKVSTFKHPAMLEDS